MESSGPTSTIPEIIVIRPRHNYAEDFCIEFLEKGFLIGRKYYKYSWLIEIEMVPSYGSGRYTSHDLCICYGSAERTKLYWTSHDQTNGSEYERNRAAEQYRIMNKVYDTLVKKRDEYIRRKV